MATGDQNDMLGRLRAALPTGWFPATAPGALTSTPVLDAILSGFANTWAWAYSLWAYAGQQARIATSTDVWLDLIGQDFFGYRMARNALETDTTYRARILSEVLRIRGTRAALSKMLIQLTGQTPAIFEPANTSDTGGYTIGGVGYGVGGGYGCLALPFQAFVTAYRPAGAGIATVGGYGNTTLAPYGGGGYGVGAMEYANPSLLTGNVTDATIQQAVAGVIPAGTIAWLNITNKNGLPSAFLADSTGEYLADATGGFVSG